VNIEPGHGVRAVMTDVRQTFDSIAREFDLTRGRPWPEVVEFIESLPGNSVMLDAGCGNGRHTLPAVSGGHRITALDISRELINIAREHVREAGLTGMESGIEFVNGDLTALPFPGECFDAAICIAVIHHIPGRDNRVRALSEIRRILRYGGAALVSVWAFDQPRFREVLERHESGNFSPLTGFGDVMVPWKYSKEKSRDRFYHLFMGGELQELCETAGFDEVTEFRGGHNWYARLNK